MSTITKLDPNHRWARSARRELLSHMEYQFRILRQYPTHVRSEVAEFCAEAIDLLSAVIADPRRDGEAKNRIAQRVAREFRAMLADIQKRETEMRAAAEANERTLIAEAKRAAEAAKKPWNRIKAVFSKWRKP